MENEEPAHLYVATLDDGTQALVTVWPDADAEIAFRTDDAETWSAPTPMRHWLWRAKDFPADRGVGSERGSRDE